MAVADKDLDEAWSWLSKQAQREEILRLATLSRMVDKPLMSYLEERPGLLLADIESTERERRVPAAMSLINSGSASRGLLLNYLATSDSAYGRAVALFVLTRIVDNVSSVLVTRLVECSEEAEVVRLLQAMREGRLPWEGVLEILVSSSSSAVRKATGRLVLTAELSPQTKVEILRRALKTENPPAVLDALRVVTELGRPELVPDVAKLLERGWGKSSPDAIRTQVQACYTLASIGFAGDVLPVLRPIVVKGYKAALLGGWDSEVRCAAAWAIGRLQTDEGREVLGTLLKDSDAAVRGAARLALETPAARDVSAADPTDWTAEIP
jgi:HEAT repeat protein